MITIIGAGNLAWQLAPALEAAGYRVLEIYNRTTHAAEALAGRLYSCAVKTDTDFSDSPSSLFILAVSDDAVPELAEQLTFPEGALVVHTSGSVRLAALQKALPDTVDCGVFYPLMTFSKQKSLSWEHVPLCIEAADMDSEAELLAIARKLSKSVQVISSDQRQALHLSAVFACNFTNHLWAISTEITEANGLDFSLLKPLIQETYQKAMSAAHPADVQTGPAVRHDQSTIDRHLALLEEDEPLTEIYEIMTASIQTFFEEG